MRCPKNTILSGTLGRRMRQLRITTEEGYKKVTARVDKAAEILEGKWLDPKYAEWAEKYEMLAVALLNWEIENNLLPI